MIVAIHIEAEVTPSPVDTFDDMVAAIQQLIQPGGTVAGIRVEFDPAETLVEDEHTGFRLWLRREG